MASPQRRSPRKAGPRSLSSFSRPRLRPSTSPVPTPSQRSAAAAAEESDLSGDLQQRLAETINRTVGLGCSPEEVARTVLAELVAAIGGGPGAVYLRDEETRGMRCLADAGLADEKPPAGWTRIVSRIVKEGRPLPGPGLLACPLIRGGRAEGALLLQAPPKPSASRERLAAIMMFTSTLLAEGLAHARLAQKYAQKIERLQRLQGISQLLNSTLNQATIRNRAIEGTMALVEAEAGSLLLLDEATGELYFEVALGEKGEAVREIRLKPGQGIAGHVAQTGQAVIVNDVQQDPRFAPQADRKSGFVTRNMVCAPVAVRDKILGVLQALNKRDGRQFAQEDLQDLVTLGHQVGIAIENANLYEEINRLLEGFITASVLAIESRDPTTSGHSERVATLTGGLAEVVDRIDRGPYADIRFNHEQMKEIRYAAVLHDFGKVGVREHVLVKAQKLHPGDLDVLKARFDFIKRTFEAQALQRKVEILMSGDREATVHLLEEIDASLARQIAETDGILDFLLACNQPTVLPRAGFERLQEIARLTYPSFDGHEPYLTPHEVVTLSIPKGSLTAEERTQIEEHVTHTYRFLSTIPWSRSLKNIPQIAYGHHEKLDGTGYPRRAPGVVLPVQTRMMTICDIYDALTASDRPYKTAMSVPSALSILEEEVRQGKVDGDLFELFVGAEVYRRVSRPAG